VSNIDRGDAVDAVEVAPPQSPVPSGRGLGRALGAPFRWLGRTRLGRGVANFVFPESEQKYTDPAFDFMNPSRIIRTGLTVVILFTVGFLGWAAFAPLGSALIAQGVVVVESHRKTIQHLEGGIVRTIFVREGEVVKAGQPLIELDATEARASLALLMGQADALTAQEARLEAERDGADHISFPPELVARQDDPKVAEAIRGETNSFVSRRDTLRKQIDILNQRISENGSIIAGLQKEQAAVEQQATLIDQETQSVQGLYQKGLSTLPRLLQLQRQAADLGGQRGQIVEKIGQVQLNSGEDQLQIVQLKNQFQSDLMKDLRDAQTKRFDTLDRLHAAKDVVSRLVMTAPVAGKVVSLAAHTKGAVIRPGDTVMEIVPINDQLSVEAHVRPEDADEVHIGMTARVNLGAYKQRRLPMISGVVTAMSADRLTDQRTGQAYFNVMVDVDLKQLKGYHDIRFIPGMPVDVNIDTGNRTMLDYFLEPITGVFNRGMRER